MNWLKMKGDRGVFYAPHWEFPYDDDELDRMNEESSRPPEIVSAYPGELSFVLLVEGYGFKPYDGGTGAAQYEVFASKEEARAFMEEERRR